jgi:hypothetical protein
MTPPWLRVVRRSLWPIARWRYRLRQWWLCRTERCDYYHHYLAYGPPDMPHATWHYVMAEAQRHFTNCTYHERPRARDSFVLGEPDLCPTCRSYEKRIRA